MGDDLISDSEYDYTLPEAPAAAVLEDPDFTYEPPQATPQAEEDPDYTYEPPAPPRRFWNPEGAVGQDAPEATGGAELGRAIAQKVVGSDQDRNWVQQGVRYTASELWNGLRKDSVYFYGGMSRAQYGLLHPVADAFDFYAEKLGLKAKEKQSAFTRFVDGLREVADLTSEAAGPKAPGEEVPAAIAGGAGSLATSLPLYGAAIHRLGPAGLAAIGAVEAAPSGDAREVARAALGGFIMQGSLHATQPLATPLRVPVQAAIFGGMTAAEGGDLEETIGSALLGAGLAATSPGPKMSETRAQISEAARQISESNWYRKLTIRERGLVVQDLSQKIAGLKAIGMTEGQILRTLNRVYGGKSPEFQEAWRIRGGGSAPEGTGAPGAGPGEPGQGATPPGPPAPPDVGGTGGAPPKPAGAPTGIRLVSSERAAPWQADSPLDPAKVGRGVWAWADMADPALTAARQAKTAMASGVQDRDRTRAASDQANAERLAKFSPRQLVDSVLSDSGAPILDGTTGRPLAGYGRLQTLESVYALPPEDPRRAALAKMIETEGVQRVGSPPPADMAQPVLVRLAKELENTNPEEYAAHSNHQIVMGFSDAELARRDAKTLLERNMLSGLNVPESGDVLAASNRDFVRAFIDMTGDRATLVDSMGEPDAKAAARIKRAVMTSLLIGDPQASETITALTERAGDYGLQDTLNGLTAVAPELAKLKADRPSFDLTPELSRVMPILVEAKRAVLSGEVKSVGDHLAQRDFFRQATEEDKVLAELLLGAKSAKEIREKFADYVELARRYDENTLDMFPGMPQQRKIDLLVRIWKGIDDAKATGNQGGLTPSGPDRARPQGTGGAEAAGPAGPGKLDNPAAYRADADSGLSELDNLLPPEAPGAVHEPPAVYAGDLAAGSQGETPFRRSLRLVTESKGIGPATARPDVLATRALQQKASALLQAVDSGKMTEAAAAEAWRKAQAQIGRSQRRIENRPAGRRPIEGDLFAPAGPAPGMLLESQEPYSTLQRPLANLSVRSDMRKLPNWVRPYVQASRQAERLKKAAWPEQKHKNQVANAWLEGLRLRTVSEDPEVLMRRYADDFEGKMIACEMSPAAIRQEVEFLRVALRQMSQKQDGDRYGDMLGYMGRLLAAQKSNQWEGNQKLLFEDRPAYVYLTGGSSMQVREPAWHGSPYSFNRFSNLMVGSGEGSQSFGWGLYFAGKREVAEYYRDRARVWGWASPEARARYDDPDLDDALKRELFRRTPEEILRLNKQYADLEAETGESSIMAQMYNALARGDFRQEAGKLYHVELAPEEEDYLLWDEPLVAQSRKVRRALQSAQERGDRRLRIAEAMKPGAVDFWQQTGETLYNRLPGAFGALDKQMASEYLHKLGIRGIKYLDQQSRDAAEWFIEYEDGRTPTAFWTEEEAAEKLKEWKDRGARAVVHHPRTYNYVIFSEDDVAIRAVQEAREGYGVDPDAKIIEAGVKAVLGTVQGREPTIEEARSALSRFGARIEPYIERIHAAAVQAARTGLYDMQAGLRQGDAVTPQGTVTAAANPTRRRTDLKIAGGRSIPTPPEHVSAKGYNADDDQLLGINLALDRFSKGGRGFLMADGTGMGKTTQLLVVADEWAKRSAKPVLIVTQNYLVARGSFVDDARRLKLDLGKMVITTYKGISGPQPKRYANVATGKRQVPLDGDFGLVIFDEAHNLKNDDSSKRIEAMRIAAKADHILFATATPMDRPVSAAYFMSEITGIPRNQVADLLGFSIVPEQQPDGKIIERCVLKSGFSWDQVDQNLLKLREIAVRHGALVRREYPFMGTFETREIPMPAELRATERKINDYFDEVIARIPPRAWKWRSIVNQQRTHSLNNWTEQHKIPALMEEVRNSLSAGRRPVIVVEYVSPSGRLRRPTVRTDAHGRPSRLDMLRQRAWDRVFPNTEEIPIHGSAETIAVALQGEKISFARIYGNAKKDVEVERFQQGKVQAALMTVSSGGTGINLDDTVGNSPRDMILLGYGFAGDVMQQALGRISRRNTASFGRAIFVYFDGAAADAKRRTITSSKIKVLKRIQQGEDLDAATWMPNEAGLLMAEGPEDMDEAAEVRESADVPIGQGYSARITPAGDWELQAPQGKVTRLDVNNPEHQRLIDKLSGEGQNRVAEDQMAFQFGGLDHEDLFHAAAAKGIPADERPAVVQGELQALASVSGTSGQPYHPAELPSVGGQAPAAGVGGEENLLSPSEAQKAAALALQNPYNADYWANAWAHGETVSSVIAENLRRPDVRGWNMRGYLVDSPQAVAALHMTVDAGTQEVFAAMYLDSRRRTIETRIITIGIINASLVHPREVFGNMPKGTVAVALSHNHPGGDPSPSAADVRVGRDMDAAAKVANVALFDSVVTNGGKFYSMRESSIVSFDSVRVGPHEPRVIPRKEFKETPPIPQKHAWELVSRSDLAHIGAPDELIPIAKTLSQHDAPGKFAYLIYLNGKNRMTAVTRIPRDSMAPEIISQVAQNSGRHGAVAVVVSIPGGLDTATGMPKDEALWETRKIVDGLQKTGVKALDVLLAPEWSDPAGAHWPCRSTRVEGDVMFDTSDFEGTGEPREPYGEKDLVYLAKRIDGAVRADPDDVIARINEEADSVARGVGFAALPWMGSRPLQPAAGQPAGPALGSAADPAVEARLKAAETEDRPSWLERVSDGIHQLKRAATRPYPDLETGRGRVRALLDELQVLGEASKNLAKYNLHAILSGLDRNRYRLFSRILVARDLLQDVKGGLYPKDAPLPFGWKDAAAIEGDLAGWQALADANPEVEQALQRRKDLLGAVRRTLVDMGKLPESVRDNDDYWHHVVLDRIAEKRSGLGVSSQDLKRRKRSWQKERSGYSGDYLTDYLETEYEVLSQAYHDIRQEAIREQLRAAAPDRTRELRGVARHRNEINVVGGPAVWQEIEQLKGRRAELVDADGHVEDRQLFAQLTERIWELDPLMPFRQRKAIALSKLREAMGLDKGDELAEGDEGLMAQIARWANDTNPEIAVPARQFFKAVGDQAAFTKQTLGAQYLTGERGYERIDARLIPEGFVRFQPEPGNRLYRAKTITEQALEAVLAGEKELESAVRDGIVLGGLKEEWVVPADVAATLQGMSTREPMGLIARQSARLMSAWKQYQLFSPPRFVKYNLNNLFGDNDFALALEPRIYAEAQRAMRDSWQFHMKRRSPTGDLLTMLRLGVVSAGQVPTEMSGIREHEYFELLTGNRPNLVRRYLNLTTTLSMTREDILRIAAFRYYRRELAAGRAPWQLHHAAPWEEAEDLWKARGQDPEALDRLAALMSNSALINYATPTELGKHLRQHAIPFWRWVEGNTGRYWQYLVNEIHAGREESARARIAGAAALRVGGRLARYGALVGVLSGIIALWNRLRYPDEDALLRRGGRRGYLIVGRRTDGTPICMTVQGAWRDLLTTFGLPNPIATAIDVAKGRKTLREVGSDVAAGIPNRLMQGFAPWYKAPVEVAARVSMYPDIRKRTPIRDLGEYFANQAGLRVAYAQITGKPLPEELRGWRGAMKSWLVYYTDPGEMAYWRARENVRRWMKANRLPVSEGTLIGDRANDLYYWRKAVQWEDEPAARRYLRKYIAKGGTPQGLVGSIRSADPLASLPKKYQPAYLSAIRGEELQILQDAYRWYGKVYNPAASKPASPTSALP